jgi:hypothetical protein
VPISGRGQAALPLVWQGQGCVAGYRPVEAERDEIAVAGSLLRVVPRDPREPYWPGYIIWTSGSYEE